MKHRFVGLLAVMLFAIAPSALAADAQRGIAVLNDAAAKDWGTYHALVIGINDYSEWPRLQTAVKDATVIRDLLITRYGFDEKNVILRTDRAASRVQISRDLRYLATAMGASDNLLIYYAGHGQLDDLTGDGYWVPAEGKLKDPTTWVSNAYIKAVLSSDKVQAKNVVVIADSCYSGSMLRGGPSLLSLDDRKYRETLAKKAAQRSRQVISSGGIEPVADGGADGHSLFAYYLINALRTNDREVIDLENLFHTRVWKPVSEIGDQRPNVGRLKTPMDEDGQFVLYNAAWADERARQQAAQAAEKRQKASEVSVARANIDLERQRIEMEKQRLEYERAQLAKEKELEMARLELEKQKQAIELAKMQAQLAEMARKNQKSETPTVAAAPAAPTAPVPAAPKAAAPATPKAAAPATPATASPAAPTATAPAAPEAAAPVLAAVTPDRKPPVPDKKQLVASVFPFHIKNDASRHADGQMHLTRDICFKGLLEFIRRENLGRLSPAYEPDSFYDTDFVTQGTVIPKDELDKIWRKPSLFSNQVNPHLDTVVSYVREFDTDMAILVSFRVDPTWAMTLHLYLVNPASGRVVTRVVKRGWRADWTSIVSKMAASAYAEYRLAN